VCRFSTPCLGLASIISGPVPWSRYAITVTSKVPATNVTVDRGVSTTLKPEGVLFVMVTKQGCDGVTCTSGRKQAVAEAICETDGGADSSAVAAAACIRYSGLARDRQRHALTIAEPMNIILHKGNSKNGVHSREARSMALATL